MVFMILVHRPPVWHDLYNFGMKASSLALSLSGWYVVFQSGMIFKSLVLMPPARHDLYNFGI